MYSRITNNMLADLLVLIKNNIIKWSFLIFVLITGLVLYFNHKMYSVTFSSGFYTSQLLISLMLFNVFFIIIVGSLLGSKDYDWQTYCLRICNSTRLMLLSSRLLTIVLISVLIVVFNIAEGNIFDFVSNDVEVFTFSVLLKYLTVLLITIFWGMLTFLLGLLTKSFTLSSSFGIGYLFLESFSGQLLPDFVLQFLPVWNQKSLLKYYFSTNEGMFAIVQKSYGNVSASAAIIIIYTAIVLFLSYLVSIRTNYN